MKAVTDKFSESDHLFLAVEFLIDGKRFEHDVEAEGGGQPLVTPLHNVGVQSMHDESGAELRLEAGGTAHVVEVTMGEDDRRNVLPVKAEMLDICYDGGETHTRAAVDENKFSEVKEVNGPVPEIGNGGSPNLIYATGGIVLFDVCGLAW